MALWGTPTRTWPKSTDTGHTGRGGAAIQLRRGGGRYSPRASPPPQTKGSIDAPEGTLGYVTCALAANSTKRRKKMGSSVAYKTIGTFLSQNKRHEDACGWATEMQSSGCAAVRQWPTLSFTHWT